MAAAETDNPESASALREVENGLSFLATPGPGDSEGGDIYSPVGSNPEQMPATKRLTP
jgi:hypothetical protein